MIFSLERQHVRTLAAVLAGLVVTAVALWGVLSVAPQRASASEAFEVPLHPDHVGSTAKGFGEKHCKDFKPRPEKGQDGWHFVAPGHASFQSLQLEFEYPDGAVFAFVVPSSPSANGWGFITGSHNQHAYVYTPAGVTLTGGSAVVDWGGKDWAKKPHEPKKFNLSHTCPKKPHHTTPTPTTEPPTSPPVTTEPPTSPPMTSGVPTTEPPVSTTPVGGPGGDQGSGALPKTGAALAGYLAAGAALLGGGTALLIAARRKALTSAQG